MRLVIKTKEPFGRAHHQQTPVRQKRMRRVKMTGKKEKAKPKEGKDRKGREGLLTGSKCTKVRKAVVEQHSTTNKTTSNNGENRALKTHKQRENCDQVDITP